LFFVLFCFVLFCFVLFCWCGGGCGSNHIEIAHRFVMRDNYKDINLVPPWPPLSVVCPGRCRVALLDAASARYQNKTKQNKQNKTKQKQNKTKQNKTKQNNNKQQQTTTTTHTTTQEQESTNAVAEIHPVGVVKHHKTSREL
jgi:hypothetical protein